jgi:uncharacterized protein YqjF (DUF2071 family)
MPIVMRPRWRELLFLHWPVPAQVLEPLLPPELEVDSFEGQVYIGLVPFLMRDARPRFLPDIGLRHLTDDFAEINVRTYVRHRGGSPGVWFFSLDAASLPAVIAARLWFKLPYFWARMHTRSAGRYCSRRLWPNPKPARCRLKYLLRDEEPRVSEPGSLEEFLVERYLLYSRRGSQLFCGRVQHEPYRIQSAQVLELRENLMAAAGVPTLGAPPLAHYSAGVDVSVLPLQKL